MNKKIDPFCKKVQYAGSLVGRTIAIATLAMALTTFVHANPSVRTESQGNKQEIGGLRRKAVFGAQVGPVSADEAKEAGIEASKGVKILRVLPGLTAERIGIVTGDIVTSLNGKPVSAANAVQVAMASLFAGDTLEIEVIRAGKRSKLSGPTSARPLQKADGFDVHYESFVSNGKKVRLIATSPTGAQAEGKSKFPTLFLIGGIGAYSVDSDFATMPYGNIVEAFAKSGYATVRIDKPGQGDSEGPVYTDLLFDDELAAYKGGVKKAKTLSFVDAEKIVIFGHSMGGTFGPLVAQDEPIAGLIACATLAKTWTEYQLENTRRQSLLAGAKPGEVDTEIVKLAAVTYYMFDLGWSAKEIVEKRPELAETVRGMSPDLKTFSGVGIPFFQQLAKKNLGATWDKQTCKVLMLWGENDFVSGEEDHKFVADFLNKKNPGQAKYVRIPESDHGFKKTTSFLDSFRRWASAGEKNENVIPIMREWIESILKK